MATGASEGFRQQVLKQYSGRLGKETVLLFRQEVIRIVETLERKTLPQGA